MYRIELDIIQNFNSTAKKYGIDPIASTVLTEIRDKIGHDSTKNKTNVDSINVLPKVIPFISTTKLSSLSAITTATTTTPPTTAAAESVESSLTLESTAFDPNTTYATFVECVEEEEDETLIDNIITDDPEQQSYIVDGQNIMVVHKVNAPQLVVEDNADGKIETPNEYFDPNDANMVEISTENEFVDGESIEDNNNSDDNDNDNSLGYETSGSVMNYFVEMRDESGAYTIESNIKVKSNDPLQNEKPIFMRDGVNFLCNLCTEVNDTVYDIRSMAAHMKMQHEEKLLICDICGADFRRRNEMSEHLNEHVKTTENNVYQCDSCDRSFNNLRVYRMHKRMHYNKTKSWECDQCPKKYTSKNLLDEHQNMHTGERPYKCVQCGKDFASKYTLTAHMKIHSERKRPYQCNLCPKSFFSPQNLTQHERTHTGIKEFVCNICNKAFGTQHNLDVHKIVHTGYKPFICRTCGKAFARRAEIKDHERIHTGERPFVCDICNSSFSQRSNLMSHRRATHLNEKRYECDICQKTFKRRRLMEYHKKAMHTGERPYQCEICGASFVYPEHYKKHCRIHSGDKPYKCEVCGKAFTSRDNRNAHRFVHSDKKPYECVFCNQGFMRKPLLLAHMETMNHKNEVIITNHAQISNGLEYESGDDDGEEVVEAIADDEIKQEFKYLKVDNAFESVSIFLRHKTQDRNYSLKLYFIIFTNNNFIIFSLDYN